MQRYQSQTATFTTTQPAGEFSQFGNVWTHNYKVSVNPCDNTFSGTGVETGHDQNGPATTNETVTGTFNADGTISLVNTRDDGVVWSLNNVKTDGSVTLAKLIAPAIPSNLEFKATAPVITNSSNQEPRRLRVVAGWRLGRSALLHWDADQQQQVTGRTIDSSPLRRALLSLSGLSARIRPSRAARAQIQLDCAEMRWLPHGGDIPFRIGMAGPDAAA